MISFPERLGRVVGGTLTFLTVAAVLAGCTAPRPENRKPSVDPDAAKQQMIDAIDAMTERLGGEWKGRTGPDYAERCQLPDGSDGAHWVYLTGRTEAPPTEDPEHDAAAMRELWTDWGMTFERWADSDGPAIAARGGSSIASTNLYAFPGNYALEAISLCFPGDADRL